MMPDLAVMAFAWQDAARFEHALMVLPPEWLTVPERDLAVKLHEARSLVFQERVRVTAECLVRLV